MCKQSKSAQAEVLWIELFVAAFIPFVLLNAFTPTYILESNTFLKIVQLIGYLGFAVCLSGIPVGIHGLSQAKKKEKRRIATILLSIVNLIFGALEASLIIWILFRLFFVGISV